MYRQSKDSYGNIHPTRSSQHRQQNYGPYLSILSTRSRRPAAYGLLLSHIPRRQSILSRMAETDHLTRDQSCVQSSQSGVQSSQSCVQSYQWCTVIPELCTVIPELCTVTQSGVQLSQSCVQSSQSGVQSSQSCVQSSQS